MRDAESSIPNFVVVVIKLNSSAIFNDHFPNDSWLLLLSPWLLGTGLLKENGRGCWNFRLGYDFKISPRLLQGFLST